VHSRNGDHTLRSGRVGQRLDHPTGHGHGTPRKPVRRERRVRVDEEVLDLAVLQRLGDNKGALYEKSSGASSFTAPEQFTGREDPGVSQGCNRVAGQLAFLSFSTASRATSTRLLNALGSLTANSASILRSNSTSASRRPAMNWL